MVWCGQPLREVVALRMAVIAVVVMLFLGALVAGPPASWLSWEPRGSPGWDEPGDVLLYDQPQRAKPPPKPPPRKSKPMPTSYEVLGAGDSSYNGTYNESGTYNGQPAYTNGSKWLWWSAGAPVAWKLSVNKGDPDLSCAYHGTFGEASLPADPWFVEAGTAPAPTLSYCATEVTWVSPAAASTQLQVFEASVEGITGALAGDKLEVLLDGDVVGEVTLTLAQTEADVVVNVGGMPAPDAGPDVTGEMEFDLRVTRGGTETQTGEERTFTIDGGTALAWVTPADDATVPMQFDLVVTGVTDPVAGELLTAFWRKPTDSTWNSHTAGGYTLLGTEVPTTEITIPCDVEGFETYGLPVGAPIEVMVLRSCKIGASNYYHIQSSPERTLTVGQPAVYWDGSVTQDARWRTGQEGRHKWSYYGPEVGGGYDENRQQLLPVYYDLLVQNMPDTACTIRLRLAGKTWFSVAMDAGARGAASYTQRLNTPLPWAKDAAWAETCKDGVTGTLTGSRIMTVQVLRDSDSEILADRQVAYTSVVPTISAYIPMGIIGGPHTSWPVTLSNCWQLSSRHRYDGEDYWLGVCLYVRDADDSIQCLYGQFGGVNGDLSPAPVLDLGNKYVIPSGQTTWYVTAGDPLAWLSQPYGYFVATIERATTADGLGTLSADEISRDDRLTSFDVTRSMVLVQPAAGSRKNPQDADPVFITAHCRQGAGGVVKFYVELTGGTWFQVGGAVAVDPSRSLEIPWPEAGRPTWATWRYCTSGAWMNPTEHTGGIRAVWYADDAESAEYARAELQIGFIDPGSLPPDPPDPGSNTPYLIMDLPAEGATVSRTFTCRLVYGGYTGTGSGHLRIVANGPGGVGLTLLDMDPYAVAAYSQGQQSLTMSLTLPASAAAGAWTLVATLAGVAGESRTDSNTVTVTDSGGGTGAQFIILDPIDNQVIGRPYTVRCAYTGMTPGLVYAVTFTMHPDANRNGTHFEAYQNCGYTFPAASGEVSFVLTGRMVGLTQDIPDGYYGLRGVVGLAGVGIVAEDWVPVTLTSGGGGPQPTIRITSPASGAIIPYEGNAWTLAYSNYQAGSATMVWHLIQGTTIVQVGTAEVTLIAAGGSLGMVDQGVPVDLLAGDYTLQASLYNATQAASDSIAVVLRAESGVAPSVRIVSPLSGTIVPPDTALPAVIAYQGYRAGTAALTLDLTDGTNTVRVGSATPTLVSAGGNIAATYTTPAVIAEGEWTLVATLTKAATPVYRQQSASGETTIEIDDEAVVPGDDPAIGIVAPATGTVVNVGQTCTVQVAYANFAAGAATLALTLGGESVYSESETLETGEQTLTATITVPDVTVGAQDLVATLTQGGDAPTDTVSVTVEAANPGSDPYLVITEPGDGATVGRTVQLGWAWGNVTPDAAAELRLYCDGTALVDAVVSVLAAGSSRRTVVLGSSIADGPHTLRVVLATTGEVVQDSVAVTVASSGGGETPYLRIMAPADQQRIQGRGVDLTAYYGYLNAGDGALTVDAVFAGETVAVLDAESVALESQGSLSEALTIPGELLGLFELQVTLEDADGTTVQDSVWVTLEAEAVPTPPTVIITSPLEAASVSGTVTVEATITDDVAVSRAALYVDGVFVAPTQSAPATGNTWRFSWPTARYANGVHTLLVRAWDVDLAAGDDSITVNLANSQADRQRVALTKLMQAAEFAAWRDTDKLRAIEVLDLPSDADLPEDIRQRYWLQVGYSVGGSVDWDDYTVVTPGRSHSVAPQPATSLQWALCFTPQRTEAEWELGSADLVRLATASNGDVLVIGTTPAAIYRFRIATNDTATFADLSALTDMPVDMVAAAGKVYVAAGSRVLVLDEDTGDLTLDIALPWPTQASAITALYASGDTLLIGADLTGGGSALYRFSWAAPQLVATHTETITAIAATGGIIYCGDDAGNILTVSGDALAVTYATGQASVTRLVARDGIVLAGTGDEGRLYMLLGTTWREIGDFGWTTVKGLATWNGSLHAGGVGTGGNYLYRDGDAGWLQTLGLENATAINDMLVTVAGASEQLFIATSDGAAAAYLYRVELSQVTGAACGLALFPLQFKCLQ